MKKFKDLQFTKNSLNTRAFLEFENNYGISVITDGYGGAGFFEVAVMKNGNVCYDTWITEDVQGWLNKGDVTILMNKIQMLKND